MINLKLPSFLATKKHAYCTNAKVCHPEKSEFQKMTNKLNISSAISFKHYIKIRLDGNQFGIVMSHTLMITLQKKRRSSDGKRSSRLGQLSKSFGKDTGPDK